MWENWIWFVKQNRRYTVIQSRVHFFCWRDITQHENDIYQVLIVFFFFISSGFDASVDFIAENMQKYMKYFD